jgi:hypothetical protein
MLTAFSVLLRASDGPAADTEQPGADGLIHGCYRANSGQLRMIAAGPVIRGWWPDW